MFGFHYAKVKTLKGGQLQRKKYSPSSKKRYRKPTNEERERNGKAVLHNEHTLSKTQSENPEEDGTYYERKNESGNTSIISVFEILGHPIQLHHVLQAIDSVYYGVDGNGQFMGFDDHGAFFDTKVFWDLTKPLDGQSEETISFLLEILK